ncbi:immunoglobulin superfamily member 5-like isoform X1 [Heterodontus francisci]|uniref:immunoglobulin superfamily member 5-like isoform X1 n=1 Tax=Heterodontus francisci TaxID=7792 RepID=UPI00355BE841
MGTVRTILKLFSISLGMCLSARIIEGPKTAFVLLNTDATFNCTVSRPWSIIIWIMNKTPVLTVVQDGPVITDPQFGQRNYTTGNTFTSELIISAVTLKNNATVMCSLQTDGSQQADLFVQVDGMVSFASTISSVVLNHSTDIICKAEGWNPVPTVSWTINETVVDSKMYTTTFQASSGHLYNALSTLNLTLSASAKVVCLATIKVLPQPKTAALIITVRQPSQDRTWLIIAIVVPIAAVLLLIILIIVIAFCIKRIKHSESSYQKEIRKMSTKKSLETNVDGHRNSGLDNFGMSTESVNDFQSSSGFPSPNQVDTWSSDTMETPVVPASNRGSQKPTLNEYMMAFSNYPRKTRHVTAV